MIQSSADCPSVGAENSGIVKTFPWALGAAPGAGAAPPAWRVAWRSAICCFKPSSSACIAMSSSWASSKSESESELLELPKLLESPGSSPPPAARSCSGASPACGSSPPPGGSWSPCCCSSPRFWCSESPWLCCSCCSCWLARLIASRACRSSLSFLSWAALAAFTSAVLAVLASSSFCAKSGLSIVPDLSVVPRDPDLEPGSDLGLMSLTFQFPVSSQR